MTTTRAGWYPDHQGALRYWDGARWTAHTAPVPPAADPRAIVVRESPQPGAVPYAQSASPSAAPPYGVPHTTAQGATLVPMYAVVPPVALPNGVGVAGFVVGLVSVFLPLIFGVIGGLTGLILSIVALAWQGRTRGLAIAGLVLSILAIILIL